MSHSEDNRYIGRYRIIRPLGVGGMGEVFLAEDPHIDRPLAIKTVKLSGAAEQVSDHRQRLLREAKAAGRLSHPNVVTLFDAAESDGVLYLAFEFIDGPDLSRRMKEMPPLTLGEVLRLVQEVASALAFAHAQGIIHRDIKPSNIMLDPRGQAKVGDFGLAKLAGESLELTRTGSVVGSPQYMSPEQVRGEALDGRTDIFSLGVLFYELLSQSRPFGGETISTLVYEILSKEPISIEQARPGLPGALVALVHQMLEKELDRRIATADQVLQQLMAIYPTVPPGLLSAPAAHMVDGNAQTSLMPSAASLGVPTPPPVPGSAPATPASISPASVSPPVFGVPLTTSAPQQAASELQTAAPVNPAAGSPPPPPPPPGVAPGSGAQVGPVQAEPVRTGPVQAGSAQAASNKGGFKVFAGLAALLLILLVGVLFVHRSGTPTGDEEVVAQSAGDGPPMTASDGAGNQNTVTSPETTSPEVASPETASPETQSSGRAEPSPDQPSSTQQQPGAASVGRPQSPPATALPVTAPPVASSPAAVPPPPTVPSSPTVSSDPSTHVTPSGTDATSVTPSTGPVKEFDALAAKADREMTAGRFFRLRVQPDEAIVRVWRRGEERARVLGRASEYGIKGKQASPLELPENGDYLMTLIADGLPDYLVLIHATESGATQSNARPRLIEASLSAVRRSPGEGLRVSQSIAFQGTPRDAIVWVDGQKRGPASNWPGGRRPRGSKFLQLTKGTHQIRLEAPGYKPYEIQVEVRATAVRRSAMVDYTLRR